MNLEDAQVLVNGMDLPTYKKDLMKNQNVLWLIENLGKRNSGHAKYSALKDWLLETAATRKLMKRSAIARHSPPPLKEGVAL